MPTAPSDQEVARRLCEALRKCINKAQSPKDPAYVKQALLNLMQTQFPTGPEDPAVQKQLGCCTFGQTKLENWLQGDCEGGGGQWTPGPCT
jgi:hypothetical protein